MNVVVLLRSRQIDFEHRPTGSSELDWMPFRELSFQYSLCGSP